VLLARLLDLKLAGCNGRQTWKGLDVVICVLHFDVLTLCNRIGRGASIAGDRYGADVMVDVFEEEGRTSAARLGVCVDVVGRGEGSERTEGENVGEGRHCDCGMI
jgi:hypothetical protein